MGTVRLCPGVQLVRESSCVLKIVLRIVRRDSGSVMRV